MTVYPKDVPIRYSLLLRSIFLQRRENVEKQAQLSDMEDSVAVTPDPALNANNDLRSLGEALMRISRMLHEHTRKLEVAVEGTYVGQAGDDRVRLLGDSLRICRTADLELGRLNQTGQRVINSLREQLEQASRAIPPLAPRPLSSPTVNFEREREALNTSISNLQRQRNELETLYEIARVLNSTLEFDKVLQVQAAVCSPIARFLPSLVAA